MKRNEERKISRLFKAAHANRQPQDLPSSWRSTVMAGISHTHMASQSASDFERLAPGFTLAATTLSVIVLIVAGFSLSELPGELMLAYTAQNFDMTLFSWANM